MTVIEEIEKFFHIIVPEGNRKHEKMWTWPIIEKCCSYDGVKELYKEVYDFYKKNIIGSNFENRNACVITLFLFALYAKLNADSWNALRKSCMEIACIDNEQWKNIIERAEVRLGKSKPQNDKMFVARVKIEAGIPLTAMNGNFDYHEKALFRIWNHIGAYHGIDWKYWAENFDWPGQEEVGACYADASRELLADLQDEPESNYLKFLQDKCFDHPNHFVDLIRGNLQNETDCFNEVPWRMLFPQFKRILDVRTSEIYVHLEMTDQMPFGWLGRVGNKVKINLIGTEEETCGYVVYSFDRRPFKRSFEDVNGRDNVDENGRILVDLWNPIQGVSATCSYGEQKDNRLLLEKLNEEDVWFFRKDSEGNGIWISEHKQKKDSYFPLYVVVSKKNSYVYGSKLKYVSQLNQDEYYDERIIFECENKQQFIDAGFLWHQMERNPVQQVMSAWSNGLKLSHINLGIPSSIDSVVYYYRQNGWHDASKLDGNKFYACRFATDCNADCRGESFAVLPEKFKYEIHCENDLWKVSFGNGIDANEAWIEDCRGNILNSISSEAFKVKHVDVVCFRFACQFGNNVTLRIPSPVSGVSWRLLSEKNEKADFAVVQDIPMVDADLVRLYYKSNLTVVGTIDVTWKFELSVDVNILAVSESCQTIVCDDSNMLMLKIPTTSVRKLFAATNHPAAIVKISVSVKNKNGKVSSEVLAITRFDTASKGNTYFYFGLLKGNILDTLPDNNRDIWIKVPCFPNTKEWNGRHRLERVNDSIDEESFNLLSANQKILMDGCNTGNYQQIAQQIRDYYGCYFEERKGLFSLNDLQFLQSYVRKCAENGIPLCNLWLLQEILHDDRLVCKLPATTDTARDKAVNRFLGLQENLMGVATKHQSANMAFDWRLVRLSSVEKYAVIDKDKLKEKIEASFDCADVENEEDENKKQLEPIFYAVVDGKLAKRDFFDLKDVYEMYFTKPWEKVETWKKAICFIVEKVILTDDDDEYRQYHGNALCYLRQLEIFDARNSSIELKKIRDWRKKQLKKEDKGEHENHPNNSVLENRRAFYAACFRKGWKKGLAMRNNSTWNVCNDGEIYYDDNLILRDIRDISEIKKPAELYGLMLCLWKNEMLSLLEQEDPSNKIIHNHKDWIDSIGFVDNLLKNLSNESVLQARIKSIPTRVKDFFDIAFGNVKKTCLENRIKEIKNILGFKKDALVTDCAFGGDVDILKGYLLNNFNQVLLGSWNIPLDVDLKKSLNEAIKEITHENVAESEKWCLVRLRSGFEDARKELKLIAVNKLSRIPDDRRYWNDLLENVKDVKGRRLYKESDIGEFFKDVYLMRAQNADTIAKKILYNADANKVISRDWRLGRLLND